MILTFVHFPADRGNLLKSYKDIEDMIPNARVDESNTWSFRTFSFCQPSEAIKLLTLDQFEELKEAGHKPRGYILNEQSTKNENWKSGLILSGLDWTAKFCHGLKSFVLLNAENANPDLLSALDSFQAECLRGGKTKKDRHKSIVCIDRYVLSWVLETAVIWQSNFDY